jgi:hypothetical protein
MPSPPLLTLSISLVGSESESDFFGTQSVDLEYVSVGDTDQFTPACVAAYETAFEEAKARGRNVKALIICNPHNPLG